MSWLRRLFGVIKGFKSRISIRGSTTPETAAKIMGANFHGFDSTAKYFGGMMPKKELRKLRRASRNIPFSEEVLRARCDTHVLFFCLPLSLLDVWCAQPSMFFYNVDLQDRNQPFAGLKARGGWLLIRKGLVPGSTNKTWEKQIALLGSRESVPSASEIAQASTVHYMKTGEWLFDGLYDRVLDVDTYCRHIYLASSRIRGLTICGGYDDDKSTALGLASCIRGGDN